MAKWLKENSIGASSLWPIEYRRIFNLDTRHIEEFFCAKLKRNVPCKYRKLIVKLVPEEKFKQLGHAEFEHDGMGVVGEANVVYDLREYLTVGRKERDEIAYSLLKNSIDRWPSDFGLKTPLLQTFLEEFKDNGYQHIIESKRRVVNTSKTHGARYKIAMDANSAKIYFCLSGKKGEPEQEQLMYECFEFKAYWLMNCKYKMSFINDNVVRFTCDMRRFKPLDFDFSEIQLG